MIGLEYFCRGTYDNFKSICIYFVSEGYTILVQDKSQNRDMEQDL